MQCGNIIKKKKQPLLFDCQIFENKSLISISGDTSGFFKVVKMWAQKGPIGF
jgi:hypothetical protein